MTWYPDTPRVHTLLNTPGSLPEYELVTRYPQSIYPAKYTVAPLRFDGRWPGCVRSNGYHQSHHPHPTFSAAGFYSRALGDGNSTVTPYYFLAGWVK